MERLTSWTRTLNEEDALLLLEEAEPGLPVSAWVERAHEVLPQLSRDRRTELVRLVRTRLLDLDGDVIADTVYLRFMREEAPGVRLDLLHGRYLFDNPWILRAQAEIVRPQLAAAEEVLAERDADRVPAAAWDAFLDRHLLPGTGPRSVQKTRSELQRNLARLGVLEPAGPDREARVRRGQPARLAFAWLVAFELRREGLGEVDVGWASRASRAAQLFAPEVPYAERCLAEGVEAGLLRRSYLAGETRLHVGRT